MNDELGKKAEDKIREWLSSEECGCLVDRLHDPMGGYYGVNNPCDFICYKYPNIYYIESKATWEDRFPFSMIRPNQHDELLVKSKAQGAYGLIVVLFASYKRAFSFNIKDIACAEAEGIKSLNIKHIDDWAVPYVELKTIPSRKLLLDYTGNIEDMILPMHKTSS